VVRKGVAKEGQEGKAHGNRSAWQDCTTVDVIVCFPHLAGHTDTSTTTTVTIFPDRGNIARCNRMPSSVLLD
jgi:hypothetical protein